MTDETPEITDAAPLPPEAVAAVEEYVGEVAVIDPADKHEVMLAMDEHDVRMLLERVQSSALRKWVYELEQGRDPAKWPRGLTVHAVQDITAMMNWSGKCRIGILHDSLEVEQITENAGNGSERFWVATVSARDELTGAVFIGSSMEPQMMRLKPSTAAAKRRDGKDIPEDNRVFDVFSRTKAIQKAQRNALAAFIPEQVEQTILAMFANDPSRVERIRTEAEAKMEELPPPLDDDEARGLLERSREIQDEIAAIGPQALIECPPGLVASYRLRSQHSHEMLRDFISWLEGRRDELAAKYGGAS